MKFTPKLIYFLKNFNTINPSICFNEGNVLRTISPTNTILASANLDTTIDKKFCIYDTSRFLNTLSLLQDPEITVEDSFVTISDSKTSIRYMCASEDLITLPPTDNIKLSKDSLCHFNISNQDMSQLYKALAILSFPEIAIIGDGKSLTLQGIDSDNRIQDNFVFNIGPIDKTFKVIINTENLKLLPGDYTVRIANSTKNKDVMIAHFTSKTDDVEYYVAVDQKSE